MNNSDLTCRPVVPSDWPSLERLFGSNGACGGCWCMWWRVPSQGKYWETARGAPNKAAFRELIESGAALGCLASAGDEPVGWCSVGPRGHYPYLERSRTIPAAGIDNAWVVTCFFIARSWRGKGVAARLLATALDTAKSSGASVLDGYPAVPKSPATRIPPAFAYTGVPQLYESADFEWLCDIGARQVWRYRFEPVARRR